MSFNIDVKLYLSKLIVEPETKESELYGFLQGGLSFVFRGRGMILLKFETESASVARRYYSLCKEVFSVTPQIRQILKTQFGKTRIYSAEISDYSACIEILRYYNIADIQQGFTLNWSIDRNLIASPQLQYAYLRGVFLSCGYLSDPYKNYLVEFRSQNSEYAHALLDFLNSFDLKATLREKKNESVVYIKRAEDVSNVLAMCGAYETVLMLQDKIAQKEMKNRLQRVVNCDTANLNKTIEVSLIQQKAIEKIIRTKGLSVLPEYLIEAAQLRMDYPESSLSELSALFDPPISRSTLDKRLKKLIQIADQL
ncbi:MAG: DNA-binding protein WhiA [Anaerofustis sp.]